MAINKRRTAFKASRNGFHFPNSFAGPVHGLCEGVVWCALDRYFGNVRGTVPPTSTTPPEGSALYVELFNRTYDYYRGIELIARLVDLIGRDDVDHYGFWHDQSLGASTQTVEWPAIKGLIDAGYPASVTLVKARSSEFLNALSSIIDPGNLLPDVLDPVNWVKCMPSMAGLNHTVLATGYELDDSTGALTIHIYDPNHPDDDSVSISIVLGQQDSALSARHSEGSSFRGFFLWPYDRRLVLVTEEAAQAAAVADDVSWVSVLL